MMSSLYIIALVLLGLCFGSFVNALVWRLRKQDELSRQKKKKKLKKHDEYSILKGRSMCPSCRNPLVWYDLLPVISWVSLRGKCRYCNKKIEDSPLVEITVALLFVWSYLAWPVELSSPWLIILFLIWLMVITGFVALSVYDLKWMELPNKIVYFLIFVALIRLLIIIGVGQVVWPVISSAIWGVLIISGTFYALFQISGGRWIGGGDVKLGIVLGLMVGGPINAVLVIFIASVLGTLSALPMILTKNIGVNSRIPFGPFLMMATFVVFLYGGEIVDFYLRLVGLS